MENTQKAVYAKDDYLYFPGDKANTIYFLFKGKAKAGSVSRKGKKILKAIYQPGELFGEFSITGNNNRNDFAQAMEKLIVLEISSDNLIRLMKMYGELSLRISQVISYRMNKVERRLESMVMDDSRSRIIDFLKDLACERGVKVDREILIQNSLTHQDIASLTDSSWQTVTTVLNELRNRELINFNRRQILVRDLDQLS